MHVFAQKIYGDFVVYNAPKEVWSLFNWLYRIVIRIMYCNMIVSRMNSKFHYVFKQSIKHVLCLYISLMTNIIEWHTFCPSLVAIIDCIHVYPSYVYLCLMDMLLTVSAHMPF
jgi:hypothetical protein